VTREFSPFKKRITCGKGIKVIRLASTVLERRKSVADVNFITFCIRGGRITQTKELHRMKYYRVKEMEKILAQCGFRVLGCFPFMRLAGKPDCRDWNISIVAMPKVKA
jgi:hypothetical protein